MAKRTTKVNTKALAKEKLNAALVEALQNAGFEVTSGDEYGFKAYSVVVRVDQHDVRVDLTTPKAHEDTYDYVLEELEEDEA